MKSVVTGSDRVDVLEVHDPAPTRMFEQCAIEGRWIPALAQCLPDQFSLRLRSKAADRLVAVKIRGKGVSLGRSGDHVAHCGIAHARREAVREHRE